MSVIKIHISYGMSSKTSNSSSYVSLKNQASQNGFLEHKASSINKRNDLMPLQLYVDWRVFIYPSNKTNVIQNKFVDGEF